MSKAADRLALAALLAKSAVPVTVVAEGVNNGMTARQWYKAARDPVVSTLVYDEEATTERYMEAAWEAALTGGTAAVNEVIAMGKGAFR